MGLGYESPYTLIFKAGTVTFLGYPLASLSGQVKVEPPFAVFSLNGSINLADILSGKLSVAFETKDVRISGSMMGAVNLPDFNCGWYNVPCRTIRSALRHTVGLPVSLANVEMDVEVAYPLTGDGWQGSFRSLHQVGPLNLAMVYQYHGGHFNIFAGTNFQNIVQIHKEATCAPEAAQTTWTLADAQEQVLFSAAANAETSPIPSVSLTTPDGAVITPANVASFPGSPMPRMPGQVGSFPSGNGVRGHVDARRRQPCRFRCDLRRAGARARAGDHVHIGIRASGPTRHPSHGKPCIRGDEGLLLFLRAVLRRRRGSHHTRHPGRFGYRQRLLGSRRGPIGYLLPLRQDGRPDEPPIVTYYSQPVEVNSGNLLRPPALREHARETR